MSTLQPLHALSLDSVQQQAFVKYFQSLPEKPPTTVRIFDRNDYYVVHGVDATTAAKEVFSSIANIKRMGVEPNKLDYLVLSKGNFEILIKKLLLVRRYRVEIYVAEGSVKNSEWAIKYKGSPGYLTQLEEVLGEGFGVGDDAAPCLMAVNIKTDPLTKGRLVGVACVTAADYQLSVAEFTDDELFTQLEPVLVHAAPAECLVPAADNDEFKALKTIMDRVNVRLTKLKRSEFSTEGLIQDLNRLLKFKEGQQQDANAFPEVTKEVAMPALAAAVRYTALINESTNFGRFRICTVESSGFLQLDAAALVALHVVAEHGAGGAAGAATHSAASRSLLGLLDHCRTPPGKRLLAQWLRQPIRDINLINERLDVVELLVRESQLRLQLHGDHLRRLPDLQALARRLTRRKASLHDCYKVYQAISRLPALLRCLAEADHPTVHASLAEPISELNEDLQKYQQMIEATMDMDAVDQGDYLVKPSFDEQLQGVRSQLDELQARADLELRRAARDLGLDPGKTLKLETNPQYGIHFRVTMKEEQSLRGNKKYTILDAVKGGVRFHSAALADIASDEQAARASYSREQDKVVAEIVSIAAGYSECLFCLSHILSRLDVLVSLAVAAAAAPEPYCRPELLEEPDLLELIDVRHPCLEVQEGVSYIPNDVIFKRGECMMQIVTGANMGGKSTWMRSCGLSVLLAHVGSLVPARRARLPRLRLLAARVGAADHEQRGHSTFMTEMLEAAAILRTATPDSLVLVDELGRGTSTYEGCGIAWSIAEELATKSECFCLFATHYHELTRLAGSLGGRVHNRHAHAAVLDGQLVLLHKILPGAAAASLGLHVARLAGLPDDVLQYAEAQQAELETDLFQETEAMTTDVAEGQKIVVDFLRRCKQIQESVASDDEMMALINKEKQLLANHNNKYVQSLVA